MKPAARIGLPVAIVAVLISAFLLTNAEREPEFSGKPLSFWLMQLFADFPRRNPKAIEALRGMGEPAVHRLSKAVEREDSFLTKQLLKHSDKVPMIGEMIPSKYWHRYLAARALGAIGTNATAAIPALKKMSQDSERTLAMSATAALVLVQSEPIERYVSAYLDNSNRTNASRAFLVLCELGPYAEEAIPALLHELESTNSRVRFKAIHVLGSVGAESEMCVQVMTNLLYDADQSIRYSAANALANCGPLAKKTTPHVARLLNDSEDLCRSSALMFLWRIVETNEFKPYAVAVKRLTNDTNSIVRSWAETVLEQKKCFP